MLYADLVLSAVTKIRQVWISIALAAAGPIRSLSTQFYRSLSPWFPAPSSLDFEF